MSLSETDINIYNDIRDWMSEETRLKGKKGRFVPRTLAHAHNEYKEIVNNKLPETWQKFQNLRNSRLPEKSNASLPIKLKVGQQVLIACALAEESLAFEAVIRGANPVAALHNGFDKLDKYIDSLREVQRYKLPPEMTLATSLESAVATYNGNIGAYEQSIPRLQTIVGLAIVAIHEQTKDHILLPTPGYTPGSIELWSQPRLSGSDSVSS